MRLIEDPIGLKVRLQSEGVRTEPRCGTRAGGAGPAEGLTLFFEGLTATVPCAAPFARDSVFSLVEEDCVVRLYERDTALLEVEIAGDPRFYSQAAPSGEPLNRIALRHGRDGIGSTVAQACNRGCLFCGIALTRESGATTAHKRPKDIAEVARAGRSEGYEHFILTTGTTGPKDSGIEHMAACAMAVKDATAGEMSVHVQFEPPGDPSWIEHAAASADTAAINIECFDPDTLMRVAPGKAALGRELYERAWKNAVELFGPGQVTCFIIAGLGEPGKSIIEGCRMLTSFGVYPFVLPLRPVPGTPLGSRRPPSAREMASIYEDVAEIVTSAGLSARDCRAGCVRCGACSAITDLTD